MRISIHAGVVHCVLRTRCTGGGGMKQGEVIWGCGGVLGCNGGGRCGGRMHRAARMGGLLAGGVHAQFTSAGVCMQQGAREGQTRGWM